MRRCTASPLCPLPPPPLTEQAPRRQARIVSPSPPARACRSTMQRAERSSRRSAALAMWREARGGETTDDYSWRAMTRARCR
jgi:hypothetical protein